MGTTPPWSLPKPLATTITQTVLTTERKVEECMYRYRKVPETRGLEEYHARRRQAGAQVPRLLGEKEERFAKLSRFARQEVGCDTPRDRANSPLTVRWPWGPARRGAPTILPAVQPAVLLRSFGAGGPRAFVTLSRKLRICISRKPGVAGACRYYFATGRVGSTASFI